VSSVLECGSDGQKPREMEYKGNYINGATGEEILKCKGKVCMFINTE
jgi:hypothetical protein